ncbi:hypothetical protein ACFWD7_19310 [Streptomyces mirabilis]|uniref:hypothetical protein n=1 Tax=Streptomyces mirabilis TaxID=68239 RepID=UPI0036A455BA
MDLAIRQARKDVEWLGMLPAQAAQAVLKTYHRAWVNCSQGRDLGWHLAFRVQILEPKPEPRSGPQVGIDVGVRVPVALSDGGIRTHGAWLTDKEQIQLLKLERRAAHRKSVRPPGAKTSRRLGETYGRIQAHRWRLL